MNLSENIERIKEVMGIGKPEVVRKGEFTNKYGEGITMALFDDGEVYFKHSDYGNEFFPLKSLIRKDIEGNSTFMIVLHQEEKDFVNNFLRDTKYQNESYNPIITESRDIFFKRRQNEFLDVLLTTFEWMDEFIEEVGSFEDYLKLILKHSIDAFFEFNEILVNIDEIEELLPTAFKSLRNDERLFRKVKEHYYSKKPNITITENHETFFKRRQRSILSNLYRTLDMLPAFGYVSLEDYVNQIVIETLDKTYTEENFEKPDIYKVDPVFDFVKQLLVNDEELFFLVKNKFKSFNPFKSTRMNESKEFAFIKRRMDTLLDYVEASYDWLSPRRFNNFDEFLKRVVFSATRDFVADHRYEIGGEYEDQLKSREDLEPIILEFIKDHPIYDEIYDHFISNQ